MERLTAHSFYLVVGLRLLLGPKFAKPVLMRHLLNDCDRCASGGSIFQKKKIRPSGSLPKRRAYDLRYLVQAEACNAHSWRGIRYQIEIQEIGRTL